MTVTQYVTSQHARESTIDIPRGVESPHHAHCCLSRVASSERKTGTRAKRGERRFACASHPMMRGVRCDLRAAGSRPTGTMAGESRHRRQ